MERDISTIYSITEEQTSLKVVKMESNLIQFGKNYDKISNKLEL